MTNIFANDENFVELRVSGITSPRELAGSIVSHIMRGNVVHLSAIGHQAVGQAVKAIPIANREIVPNGFILAAQPYFEVKQIPSVTEEGKMLERTATMFRLVKIRAL